MIMYATPIFIREDSMQNFKMDVFQNKTKKLCKLSVYRAFFIFEVDTQGIP